ncbi:MAG: aminotransferase class I/II-fold pyridoxal phosphate-dependent enzyme [Ilumatobacteraceae bacterium]
MTSHGEPTVDRAPHGGDAAAVARLIGVSLSSLIDLSASLNPFGPDVLPAVRSSLDVVARYPDVVDAEMRMATAIGVDPGLLVLTNGGAEAIALVAAVDPAGYVVDPEFSLHRRHLELATRGVPRFIGETAGRWRSNPSSPLGMLAGADEAAHVWDEAFYPLATGTWTRGDESSWRLGSLTKLWSCPGLRLGYVIAPDEERALAIRRQQPRWSVNGIAAAIIEPMLAVTDLGGWCQRIGEARSDFAAALSALGYATTATDANWVLVERPGLREALIDERVVVRDCTSFGLPGVHRVAVPEPHLIEPVLTAFARVSS